MGVDVKGKIVLARYGGLFRGLKVYNAQKAGAIGMLIYSDPADDGYMRGDVYPRGPYRPASAIQRGSVQFLSHGPGDPSTPGEPRSKGVERLPFDRKNGFPYPGWHGHRQDRCRLPRKPGDSPGCPGLGEEDRLEARRVLRHHPLAADQLRGRPADPGGPRRRERPRRLAGGLAVRVSRRAGAARGPLQDRDGLRHPTHLERHRHDQGQRRARSLGADRQPPGRLVVWRRRSRQRDGRDAGDVPGASARR